ncbi:hypothetical protein Hanom_Chr15g01370061 [Helianthus anomalus]
MFELGGASYNNGHKVGYAKGKAFTIEGKPDNDFELFKSQQAQGLSRKGVAVDVLRSVLEGGDTGVGATTGDGTGTSGQHS